MITVHHLENSRSQRVLWLLEELGLDYTVRRYERDQATMLAPAALKAVHPLGKSPVIEDEGRVLAESGAVVDYLARRYGERQGMVPASDSPDYLRYSYWLHYAEGSAMPPLLMSLVFSRLKQAPMPFFLRPVARAIADKALSGFVGPQLALHFDYLESELASRPWFAGDGFTAADIQMSFPVEAAERRLGFAKRPALKAFLARIHARPAYQRALDRGGPYELMG